MTNKEHIAVRDYQNGPWGTQHATFSRHRVSGYLISNGWGDPFFYLSPIEAKAAWRRLMPILDQMEASA